MPAANNVRITFLLLNLPFVIWFKRHSKYFLIPTEANQPTTDQADTSDSISAIIAIEETASALVAEVVAEAEAAAATAVSNGQHDTPQLITSNVKVEVRSDISSSTPIRTATDTIATKENTDPVPDSVDLETKVKNSSLPSESKQVKFFLDAPTNEISTNDGLSDLDAALDNLNDQVSSLLDEASHVKSDSPDAPLDEALATLNNEVLGLLKESRKIQDELKKVSDAKESDTKIGSRCGSSHGIDKKGVNQYFDYSLYRERSQSPPPHPLITYKWEDIRRDKEKVSMLCVCFIS